MSSILEQLRAALAAADRLKYGEQIVWSSLNTTYAVHQWITIRIAPKPKEEIYSALALQKILDDLSEGLTPRDTNPFYEDDTALYFGKKKFQENVGSIACTVTDADMLSAVISDGNFFDSNGVSKALPLVRTIEVRVFPNWDFAQQKDYKGQYKDPYMVCKTDLLKRGKVFA